MQPTSLSRAGRPGLGFALAAFALVFLHAAATALASSGAPTAALPAAARTIDDLKLTLLPIPAGTFAMGSPAGEAGHSPDEEPQTKVTISKAFWLGRTEVTQAQWRAVMGTDVLEQARRVLADETRFNFRGSEKQTSRDFFKWPKDQEPKNVVQNVADDAPMYWVNWEEVATFCRRLNERELAAGRLPAGYAYRLPTEAEWEYACRAGTTEATYGGDMVLKGLSNAPVLDAIAWYSGNSSEGYTGPGVDTAKWPEKQYPGGTAAQRTVAMKQPNAWGLYDMIGNVSEWCGDWYADKLPGGSVTDPKGAISGSGRVRRGGSFDHYAAYCRSALRYRYWPEYRLNNLGFRLAFGPVP